MDNKGKILLLLIFTVAVALRVMYVNRPFDNGLRGNAGAGYTVMAENHLRYGFLTTGLVPVMNARPVDREHFVYYEHHPPGIVALTAVMFAITGSSSEVVARFLPILLSLASIWILFQWLRRYLGTFSGLAAAALAAAVPLSAYYGPFLNFETFVIPPVLLSIYLYMRWVDEGKTGHLRWSLILLALGGLMDWIALAAGILMMLDGLLFGRGASRKKSPLPLLLYPLVAILLFLAVKGWFEIQNGRYGSPSEEGKNLLIYLINATPLNKGFKWSLFLENLGRYMTDFFTGPVLAVSLVGLIVLVLNLVKERPLSLGTRSLLILWAWGLLNLLLFASHAAIHDYWILLLYPALYGCAALAVRLKPELLTALIVTGLALFGLYRSYSIIEERRGNEERYHQGLALGELVDEGELLLAPKAPVQQVLYSKGALFPHSLPGPEGLTYILGKIKQHGYEDLELIFAVHKSEEKKYGAAIEAFKRIGVMEKRGEYILIRFKKES